MLGMCEGAMGKGGVATQVMRAVKGVGLDRGVENRETGEEQPGAQQESGEGGGSYVSPTDEINAAEIKSSKSLEASECSEG